MLVRSAVPFFFMTMCAIASAACGGANGPASSVDMAIDGTDPTSFGSGTGVGGTSNIRTGDGDDDDGNEGNVTNGEPGGGSAESTPDAAATVDGSPAMANPAADGSVSPTTTSAPDGSAGPGADPNAAGDSGSNGGSGDASDPVQETDVCQIVSYTSSQLYGPILATRDTCSSVCLTQQKDHSNLDCLWGKTDITPVGTCTIRDGAGNVVYGPTMVRQGACNTECTSLGADYAKRSCVWNGTTIFSG